MASAQRRSGTRGRPPPKRWVFSRIGMSGSSTAQSVSETRKPVVVGLLGVRTRVRLVVVVVLIPEVYRVIRIGSKLDFVHFSAVVTARRWAAAKGSKRGIADCDAINPLSQ